MEPVTVKKQASKKCRIEKNGILATTSVMKSEVRQKKRKRKERKLNEVVIELAREGMV